MSAEPSNIVFYILSYVAFCLSWSFYSPIYFSCLICYMQCIHVFQLSSISVLFNLIFPRLSTFLLESYFLLSQSGPQFSSWVIPLLLSCIESTASWIPCLLPWLILVLVKHNLQVIFYARAYGVGGLTVPQSGFNHTCLSSPLFSIQYLLPTPRCTLIPSLYGILGLLPRCTH